MTDIIPDIVPDIGSHPISGHHIGTIGPDIGKHQISGHQGCSDIGYDVPDIGKIPISGVPISGKYPISGLSRIQMPECKYDWTEPSTSTYTYTYDSTGMVIQCTYSESVRTTRSMS
jgi:hypothetical protein